MLRTAVFLLGGLALLATALPERKPKYLELFQMVRFKNLACTASSDDSMKGTCYSESECTDKGGNANGNCAQGFGVCCVFIENDCGGDIQYNNTYITNAEYPGDQEDAGTCTWNVKKVNSDVCWIRLDFDRFEMEGPNIERTNDCDVDTFQATSDVGLNSPVICGQNDGLHMYVEAGRDSGNEVQLINTFTGTGSRTFKIKVSQIECGQDWSPRHGCTQYFTGASGTFTSYNYQQRRHLNDQIVRYCFRREAGYCSAEYTPVDDDGFSLSKGIELTSGMNCAKDYLLIPQGRNTGLTSETLCAVTDEFNSYTRDRYCGNRLSCNGQDPFSSTIRTLGNGPLDVTLVTNSVEGKETLNYGLNVNFQLVGCGGILGFQNR